MEKKAQYYTFAGVLLISMVFMITATQPSMTAESDGLIQGYIDNYMQEANIVIDNSIYERKNISIELQNFTEEFIRYAASKDIDLDIVSLYSYKDMIYIANHGSVEVIAQGNTLATGKEATVTYADEVTVSYDGTDYRFAFGEGETRFRVLMVQNEQES